MPGQGDDLLWNAIAEAVIPIASREHKWNSNKLEKKIRDFFRKGIKGLEFEKKPWHQLVNDYADSVFSMLFTSLGDRDWLLEADFLLVLDAGIKETFPSKIIAQVPQQLFEGMVLAAHDRAIEEQRYLPKLWDACQVLIHGEKTRKKVFTAIDLARKEAASCPHGAKMGSNEADDFTGRWIDRTMAALSQSSEGEPEWLLPENTALQLFRSVIEAGALPLGLGQLTGTPSTSLPFVDKMVHQAYLVHCRSTNLSQPSQAKEDESSVASPKRRRTEGDDALDS